MTDTPATARTQGQPAATLLELLEGPPDDAPAIVVPDGPVLSYGALRRQVRRTADALAGFGIGRGDRVALVLPNGAEVIVAFLGTAVAATAAPLNPG
jgi:acyl-CoA synthetase (AMP-forming)/AMP-acid ligase II